MREEWPLVDTHAHVFNADMPLSPDAWRSPEKEARYEDFTRVLDTHHVPFGVIAAASMYGDYNGYTLQALDAHPHRLRATVIVKPTIDGTALRDLQSRGVVGVRWVWFNQDELPDLHSYEYRAFLRRLADTGLHVQILLGGERLDGVLKTLHNAGVEVVIDHFGFPDPTSGLDCPGFKAAVSAAKRGKAMVKMAAWHRLEGRGPQLCARLLDTCGPGKLLFGSDWPFLAAAPAYGYAECLDAYLQAVPDAGIRRAISETALRYYFWNKR